MREYLGSAVGCVQKLSRSNQEVIYFVSLQQRSMNFPCPEFLSVVFTLLTLAGSALFLATLWREEMHFLGWLQLDTRLCLNKCWFGVQQLA